MPLRTLVNLSKPLSAHHPSVVYLESETGEAPFFTMLPPPPPSPRSGSCKDQIIHIPSLAAALVKLNIKISVEDLMKAVHEEDEARRAKLNEEAERALLSKRKSTVFFFPPQWS
jgi:hypothetical protein